MMISLVLSPPLYWALIFCWKLLMLYFWCFLSHSHLIFHWPIFRAIATRPLLSWAGHTQMPFEFLPLKFLPICNFISFRKLRLLFQMPSPAYAQSHSLYLYRPSLDMRYSTYADIGAIYIINGRRWYFEYDALVKLFSRNYRINYYFHYLLISRMLEILWFFILIDIIFFFLLRYRYYKYMIHEVRQFPRAAHHSRLEYRAYRQCSA